MSGARGVAEVYQAQWAAHLNSAVANALRQTLAEKPPDPVARIGRLLSATVDGPAPQFVPLSASPSDPLSQAQSDATYNFRWKPDIKATVTQALKQTLFVRPADPVAYVGRLLLATSNAGAVTALEAENASLRALEAENASLRAQLERERAMRAIDPSLASSSTSKLKTMHESEHAGGEWTIEGFVASLPVPSAVAAALRHKSSVLAGGEFDFVRSFTSEAVIVERLREGELIESVAKEVWAGTQKLQTAKAASGAEQAPEVASPRAASSPHAERSQASPVVPEALQPVAKEMSATAEPVEAVESASHLKPPHFGPDALLASVESGAIAPLRGSWLVDLEARGGRVQRRQDLPPEAFFPADELRRLTEALGDDYGLLYVGLS